MKFSGGFSLKSFLSLLWILHAVSAEEFNDEDNFVPVTQEPLIYYPQPRIVGGRNANANQFPHQISLRVNGRHICGGSIISKNYIVTAAHCVTTGSGVFLQKTAASVITIRVGTTQVNSGGIVVGVSEVKPHPSYRNFNNDIAVLKLSKSLEFSNGIKAVALATQIPTAGSAVVTSGWGRLRTGGPTPQGLQYNTLKAISNAECSRMIGSVPTSLLCLSHSVGNGVCNGDSGGPAIFNNQLVGVTNFVVGGCGSNAPDGYANVAYFNNWIKSNTDL